MILSAFLGWIYRQTNSVEIRTDSLVMGVKTAHAQSVEEKPSLAISHLNAKESHLNADFTISRLVECENRDRITNLVIMDTNGKQSGGILMFQFATLEYYAKRYGLRTELTKEDWLNPSLQRETAIKMLEENPQNIFHWKNCAIKQKLLTMK